MRPMVASDEPLRKAACPEPGSGQAKTGQSFLPKGMRNLAVA